MKQMITKTLAELPVPDTTVLEWQVLHDVVTNDATLADVVSIVKPEYFDAPKAEIWQSIVDLFNDGKRVDATVIGSLFPKAIPYIFATGMPDTGILDARQHATMLRDAAARRRMYLSGFQLMERAQQAMPEAAVYASVEEATAGIQEADAQQETSLLDIINQIGDAAQRRKEELAAGIDAKVPTGIGVLDACTYGGFGAGDFVILAARPSVGKTALMLQMAKTAAKFGKKVGIFSLEMTKAQLGERLLFSTGRVNPAALAKGEPDWTDFEDAGRELASLPIIINDEVRTLPEIISRMTLLHNAGKLDVCYIDYLSLIDACADARMRQDLVIGKITREIKVTAKRLGVPVIMLCQLNRELDKEKRSPRLSDLRDSGSIEQDTDGVLMLQQVEAPGEDVPDLLLWVRKNRHGKRDFAITLRPNSTYSSFSEGCVVTE